MSSPDISTSIICEESTLLQCPKTVAATSDKEEVQVARRLQGNWTYKSQSMVSCWALIKLSTRTVWIQIFPKLEWTPMELPWLCGRFWQYFLQQQYPVSTTLLYSDFPLQGSSVMCFQTGGSPLSVFTEPVETSEACSCMFLYIATYDWLYLSLH